MNKKLVLLGACMLLGAASLSAQKRVTGRVVDSQGEAVIGATVRVPGTKVVVVTDEDGKFTLENIPASAKKLTVSYIGMESQTVNVAGNVQVVMQDNQLNEAVVVGYGTAKKVGTVVGSVKKVSGEVVAGKPNVNIADALQGQVAGMQVLNSSGDVGDFTNISITVRGIGSISASSDPLVVVDGTPCGMAVLAMLSDNDIESVTVLKDASATSIYGSRAANGVIFVATKRGRAGEKARVSISQKIGWSQLARRIGNPMTADELLDFQLEHSIISPTAYARYKNHGANTDWDSYAFDKAAPMYETNFNVQGGTERTNYFVSGGYLKQNGLTVSSNMKRYSMRTNLDTKLNDWLAMGVNQSFAYSESMTNNMTYNGSNYLYSFSTLTTNFPRYWDPFDPEVSEAHKLWGAGDMYDPKYALEGNPVNYRDMVYSGNAFIQITPIKGLTIKSQLGLYATESRNSSRLLPSHAQVFDKEEGSASESFSRSSMWTITNTAEYKFTVAKEHNITLLAGHEGIKSDAQSFNARVAGIADDRLMLLSHGKTPEAPSQSKSKYEFLSFFGRADWDYKAKYAANVTVRSDASSRFGKENRTAVFVSGGLSWNIAREYFMRPVTWLSDLKLKVSVGSTGNAAVGNYGHLALAGTADYNGTTGWGYAQLPNPDLGWEKQIQTNVGISATFFEKLKVDVNLYHRKTKDMLMSTPLPYTTGFSSMMNNVGEMSNRGVEIEASYDIIRNKDVYFSLRGNYTYNKNKVDKLFYDLDEWPMKSSLLCLKKGESLNFYMPIFAGIDKEDGAPMWYKVGYKGEPGYTFNPETMTKDEAQIENLYQDTGKSYYAPHHGGFGFTFSWKGLSIVADFSYVLGKHMVNNAYFLSTASSTAKQGFNMDRDALDMWRNPGDETYLPSYEYDSQFDTHLLENASFMRLKNLSISYDLPKKWMDATKFMSNVRINFTTRNLFTVTKYKGADPEVDTNIALGGYPATRQFVLGAEISF